MKSHLKTLIQVMGLLAFLRLLMNIFSYLEIPSIASATGIQSFNLFDKVISFLIHPATFVILSATTSLILINKIVNSSTEKAMRKVYTSLFSWSVMFSFLFFFLLHR